MTIEQIHDLFAQRLRSGALNEVQLQDAVGQVLSEAGIPASREHAFTRKDRIDFFIPDRRIGVEVKIAPGSGAIARQLERYAPHCPGGLILVTTRVANIPPFLRIPFFNLLLLPW